MVCRACKSENLQKVNGELTVSLQGLKTLEVPPIYVCQAVLVCMDCGFTELVMPAAELVSLKKASAASGS
jgi:prolyl-tRNA editing enzyme YbaK/EbsC (Cys-tRNA(Pro) deacylase)